MKYNKIILENLQKVALKRVRIKVDPASIGVAEDLTRCNGYEGYVLAETAESMKVLVVIPGPEGNTSVVDVPLEYLELLLQNLNNIKMDSFKNFIVSALEVAEDDPIIQQIHACESIDDIEVFLKDRGLDQDEIAKLYKYYINHE